MRTQDILQYREATGRLYRTGGRNAENYVRPLSLERRGTIIKAGGHKFLRNQNFIIGLDSFLHTLYIYRENTSLCIDYRVLQSYSI